MAKQLTEREKFLQEVAAIKKVGLLLLDVPADKRAIVINAVLSKQREPVKRKYTVKKKARRKKKQS